MMLALHYEMINLDKKDPNHESTHKDVREWRKGALCNM